MLPNSLVKLARHQLILSWKGIGVSLSSTDTVPEELLATSRSGLPSPLTSVATIQTGVEPTSKVKGVANVPSPRPISTEIEPEAAFATARSSFPSRLKSQTKTKDGFVSTGEVSGDWKNPFPRLSSTETVPGGTGLALTTAKSSFPSRLKSPATTEAGLAPAATVRAD